MLVSKYVPHCELKSPGLVKGLQVTKLDGVYIGWNEK